jgi:hypothetical protein
MIPRSLEAELEPLEVLDAAARRDVEVLAVKGDMGRCKVKT